eukprot:7327694-Prymnesium_polylepis.2
MAARDSMRPEAMAALRAQTAQLRQMDRQAEEGEEEEEEEEGEEEEEEEVILESDPDIDPYERAEAEANKYDTMYLKVARTLPREPSNPFSPPPSLEPEPSR